MTIDNYDRLRSKQPVLQPLDEIERFANRTPLEDLDSVFEDSQEDNLIAVYRKEMLSKARVVSQRSVIWSDTLPSFQMTFRAAEAQDYISAPVSSGVKEADQGSFPHSGLPTVHKWMWLFLVVLALAWGIFTGAALFAGVGVSPNSAVFGALATLGLSVTLFLLGAEDKRRRG